MPAPSIVCGRTDVALAPAPIDPAWIIAGRPVARNALLSRSRDCTARTIVWDCTPGTFMWHYDTDETIHLLAGTVVLDDGTAPPRRLGAGDVVFFPAGAVVCWTVETHLRKLAFFRRPLPGPFAALARAADRLRTLLVPRHRNGIAADEARSTDAPAVTESEG